MASADYLKQYQDFTNSRVKPEDYIKRYSDELGVNAARDSVIGARTAIKATEDTIAGAPAGVAGRTSGALVTEAQRNRLVQNEVAPLQDVLRQQNSGLSTATSDYSDLQSTAAQRATAAYQGDESKGKSLMDLYNAALQAEQEAERKRQFELQLAENKRQFDAQLAASKAAASRAFSPSLGSGGSTASSSAPAVMAKKSNGSGFNFATSSGQSISAAKYAALTNQDIRSVLYTMGQQGDKYAAQVYNQLRQDPFFGKGNASYDARVKATYSPLFWGT